MDAKRDDGGEEGESVALLVGAGALEKLQGDGMAGLAVLEEAMEEGKDNSTIPTRQEHKGEHESEDTRAADCTVVESMHAAPPPPPPVQLYRQASSQSHEQPRLEKHLQAYPLEPVAESKRDVDDDDEAQATRSDEWASTRRSGKRMQQAPRAASGRPSVGIVHGKEAQRGAPVSSRQQLGRQMAEEDKSLMHFPNVEKEPSGPCGLAIQPEFKNETPVDADMDYGLQEEKPCVAAESSAPLSCGPTVAETLQIGNEIDEPPKALRPAKAVEDSDVPSISLDDAVGNETEAAVDAAHGYRQISSLSTVHPSTRAEESVAATTPSFVSTTPTVSVVGVGTEASMLPEAAGSMSLAPSINLEEQEWMPCMSDSGHTYYYNRCTQECRWQRPQTPELSQGAFMAIMTADGAKYLERLLVEGLDPSTANKDGVTLLHMAAQTGNELAVELLVSYGAAVDSTTTVTPLLTACQRGHSRIAKTLLECGASPERTDGNGNSTLHLAVLSRNYDVLCEVLDATGDGLVNQQNAEGETALHIATKLDNAEAVQALLDHGADPQIEDVQGQSPLIIAILENSVKCVQLLQSVQPSPGAVSGAQDGTASQVQATDPYAANEESENDVDKLLASIVPTPESCDHEVLEALRSFADETQRAISTLEDQLQEKKRNEKNNHTQIQALSSSLQAANNELEKEKQMRLQVEANAASKAYEHEAMRASLVATIVRCAMLESIARDAHAKLRKERKERAHSEDAMHDRLQQSLDENASLLQSLYALQAVSAPSTSETQLFVDRPRKNPRLSGSIKKVSTPARYVQYPDAANAFGEQGHSPYPSTDRSYQDQRGQHEIQPPRQVTFAEPSIINRRVKREEVRTGSATTDYSDDVDSNARNTGRTPPSRVGAVWNRFYENLGQVGAAVRDFDTGNAPSQAAPRTAGSVFDAIRRSDLQRLQSLLLSGSSPNQRDPAEKGTPLHLACELGDLDAVVLLCDFAADLEARDEEDNTPLLASCAQGNYECTKFLLQSAASLNAVNASGQTALHLAAWDGSAECVAILIEYGIDTSLTNSYGLTALGNLKTRSPLRHKLDDMAPDHPIRATIRILEEYEAEQMQQEEGREEKRSQDREANIAPLLSPPASQPPPTRSTWKEWLFGAAKAPADGSIADNSGDANSEADDDERKSIRGDGNELSSYSDAELDASSFQTVAYPPLTPPPEVMEALNRARKR